jgi:hypothetical protein
MQNSKYSDLSSILLCRLLAEHRKQNVCFKKALFKLPPRLHKSQAQLSEKNITDVIYGKGKVKGKDVPVLN